MRAARVPAAVVVGREDSDPKTADLYEVAGCNLMEGYAPGRDRLEQPPRAGRDDKDRGRGDQPKRGQMGVVGVQV
jgi:hypothetical protein